MKIKTITCHDVYNVGASLQAYALSHYLNSLGHDTEIIDYKPDYLIHYKLTGIGNPKYDRPFLREAYNLAKLPGRIRARCSKRKKEFDAFTETYLPLTELRYASNEELKADPPEADLYLAGSDQIWNTVFKNGKDPAFYLDFVPDGRKRASYAASFSTDDIPDDLKPQIGEWLSRLDRISVREKSGTELVKILLPQKEAVTVLDPVFLLSGREWLEIEKDMGLRESYLLVYDFDGNPSIRDLAMKKAKENSLKIYSVLPSEYADRSFSEEGPQGFLYLVRHAQLVISNSFHATAFSLIFGKDFAVFNRIESINTRMRDLIESVGLNYSESVVVMKTTDEAIRKLDAQIDESKKYLDMVLDSVK